MSSWTVNRVGLKKRKSSQQKYKSVATKRKKQPPADGSAQTSPPDAEESDAVSVALVIMQKERARISDELRIARQDLAALSNNRASILHRQEIDERISTLQQQLEEHDCGYKTIVTKDLLSELTSVHTSCSKTVSIEPPTKGKPVPLADVSSRLRRKPHATEGNLEVRTAQNITKETIVMDDINLVFGADVPPATYVHETQRCECGAEIPAMLTDGNSVCTVCGRTCATLDTTTSALAYGDKVECTTFSYKRQNHFLEWVQAFQGKQKTVIPEDIILSVCEEIKAQGIQEVTEITPKDIRTILKKLKHRKYYEHSILIHHLVTGIEPPRLLPNEEDQLRCLFLAMQAPFEKFLPNDRKNFLSYSYVMYKLLELLGMDQYLSCFSLLKGKDKLARQDRIFQKICIANDWEFIPSV